MTPLQVNLNHTRYQALLGVGGIGAGRVFAVKGNHTLGREESRAGHFLPNRDYCKLHIIAHYVKVLLGSAFVTIPIGKVGDDAMGRQLVLEMQQVGLDTQYVQICDQAPTMYSICIVYPDGSGGNLTTDDSACTYVDAAYVAEARSEFARYAGRGIALAAPEAPLTARAKLLQLGTDYEFFCVASFVSAEIQTAIATGLLDQVDLLALNLDEAATAAGLSAADTSLECIVETAVQKLSAINPVIWISITAGRRGGWIWDGAALRFTPTVEVEAVSPAGAGDAHLAGLMVGLVAGLSLQQAQELALLVAALSVTSPHTIHPSLDSDALRAFVAARKLPLSTGIDQLLAK